MAELKKAITKMKLKGAAGPDEIFLMFLKSLGPHALNELLEIYHLSFLYGDCPKIWRIATITPLLKSKNQLAKWHPSVQSVSPRASLN